jgi:glycosyltransferase involved in cell wall biosynthesis
MVVCDLARLTNPGHFDVHVVCLRHLGGLGERLAAQGLTIHNLGCEELPKVRTLTRLARLLSNLRPAVLHTHNPTPHFFGCFAARLSGVPVLIHTKHGRNYPHKWRAVLGNRLATSLTDCVVPVSDASARVARDIEHVPRRKLLVIRNGIDPSEFPTPDLEAESECRAIHVGRLIPLKDQFTLLRATRLVVDAAAEFRLDIVGDGPAREELNALAAELRLTNHVRFLGLRKDVRTLLPSAEFFVLCSWSEGLSISILEAMAAGLPVVATDVGGNREIVAEGRTGFLVPAKSPNALARAMLELHHNPALLRRMGQAARARIEQEFNLNRVVARYEELYTRLLASKGIRIAV